MKLQKVLCMMAVSVAVSVAGLTTNVPILVHAEETQNVAGLDDIMRTAYSLYMNNDYAALYSLSTLDAVQYYADQLASSGSDRYICDIDGNTRAMLYIASADDYWWYFGQMEGDLRQGIGTTISVDDSAYEFYTGSYFADFPFGEGILRHIYTDGGDFSITGTFQGAFLNGTYQVDYTRSNGQFCSVQLPYINNHLQAFDYATINGTGLDGTGYIWYLPYGSDHNTVGIQYSIAALYSYSHVRPGLFLQYDDLFGNTLDLIPDDQELFAFGIYENNGDGIMSYYYDYTSTLDDGLKILRGRGTIIPPAAFYIKADNGDVCVYKSDASLYFKTQLRTENLPQDVRTELQEGIGKIVENELQVYHFIELYSTT